MPMAERFNIIDVHSPDFRVFYAIVNLKILAFPKCLIRAIESL